MLFGLQIVTFLNTFVKTSNFSMKVIFIYIEIIQCKKLEGIMNLAMIKLAMLEKNFQEKEERAQVEGLATNPADIDLRRRITKLMEQVRRI